MNIRRNFFRSDLDKVTNMEDERRQFFGWADYVIFSSTLFVSALIGVYHAVKSANTTHDYLLGGKQMGVLPISLSMAAR